MLFLLCSALAAVTPVCAQQVTREIAYTAPGAPKQTGDLYQPVGAGPFPVVLYLHGGSWRSGNKDEWSRFGRDLAAHGYASFSIDYDLHPHSFPESWNEGRAAVNFLRTHAAQYHLDPQAIVVGGSSAGGELASLLALAPEGPASGGGDHTPTPVAGAIILSGVFELQSDAHVITRYLGDRCDAVRALCRDASPAEHVHPDAPPFFIGHGSGDHVVPYGQAQAFIARLQSAGDSVSPFVAEGGPHMYWRKSQFYAANLTAVNGFLSHLFAR